MRVLGYTRVSTDEQAAGLEAQRTAIAEECLRRDWTIPDPWFEDDGFSAKDLNRPALQHALDVLAQPGQPVILMVAKLDRLSRSVADFAGLMERAQKEGWSIVALDLGVDTTTPAGEMMANVLATFAQFERKLIGARTKEALAVKKANGVKLGRPRTLPGWARDYVLEARRHGHSYFEIAKLMNDAKIPTAHGGKKWWPETVRGIVQSEGG
jgi:DNA invertase Pin-like site-specific DNA recombinase